MQEFFVHITRFYPARPNQIFSEITRPASDLHIFYPTQQYMYMYMLKIYGQHFFNFWLFSYLLQDEVSIISSQAVSQISRQGDAEFHSDTTVLNYGIEVSVWCSSSLRLALFVFWQWDKCTISVVLGGFKVYFGVAFSQALSLPSDPPKTHRDIVPGYCSTLTGSLWHFRSKFFPCSKLSFYACCLKVRFVKTEDRKILFKSSQGQNTQSLSQATLKEYTGKIIIRKSTEM